MEKGRHKGKRKKGKYKGRRKIGRGKGEKDDRREGEEGKSVSERKRDDWIKEDGVAITYFKSN